ncbi:MAG: phenylacetate--CoA ligase family protein [Myxococcales bacterium]|nr:phenylacetate--CoA ligase family protein [Myxococcales bacterium]
MLPRILFRDVLLPTAATFTPFKSWRYLEEMCQREFEPLERQRNLRMSLVRELLVHAYREVDIYRQALDRAGVDPIEVSYPTKFALVPITTKDDLREGFPNRQLARSFRGRALRYSNTSGSTGRPLLLIQDTRDIAMKYASILRSRQVGGVDPLATQVRVTPNECQPALPAGDSPSVVNPLHRNHETPGRRSAFFVFLEKQIVNPLIHARHMLEPFWRGPGGSGPVDFDGYLDQIDKLEPEVLSLYPIYALLLAKHLRRTGRKPPKITGVIDFSGGLAPPWLAARVSEAFGVRTVQSAGGCEFARYAASCPSDPSRMHLAESYAYVEAIRTDGSLCAPGELGNLIVTSLHSWAMPIIRLEPGDVGRIFDEPCACGRKSRRLEHGGRVQALLRNAEGRWVTALESWQALLSVSGLDLFQLHQRSEKDYELHVVRAPSERLDTGELDERLALLLGKDATVKITVVDSIPTEASGKLQLVKSRTYEEFRPVSVRSKRVPVN